MIRFVVGNQRNIMAYQTQQVMPIAQEGISNDETIYCKHCGAQIDADSNFCNKCEKQL